MVTHLLDPKEVGIDDAWILLECGAVDAWSLVSVSRSTNTHLICNLFPLWLLGHEVVCPFFMPYLVCKE